MSALRRLGNAFASGEGILPAILLFGGLYWVIEAFNLRIWNGPQPGSGLMPLIYGSMLFLFAAGVIYFVLREPEIAEEHPESIRKPLLLVALLILTVIGFPLIGGVVSVFVMMTIMFIAIERLPPIRSVMVAATVSAVFAIVFDRWLSVSLPHGPWGF